MRNGKLSMVIGKRLAPSLGAKIIAPGYCEDNATELASLMKDAVF